MGTITFSNGQVCEPFDVSDSGIYRQTRFGAYELLIPKEIFIEAFNKYIKETTDDGK